MHIHQPLVAPIPTMTMSQPLATTPSTSTSSNGIDKVEAMFQVLMQNLDKKFQDQRLDMQSIKHDVDLGLKNVRQDVIQQNLLMKTLGNKVIDLKGQQAQSIIPPQPYGQNLQSNRPALQRQAPWIQNNSFNNVPHAASN